MRRVEPPSLATWMIEHLTSGDRDEAIAGDLLEVFRGGRSNGWYWRQVVTACAVAWFKSLRARLSLLVFACAWSMLAPGWKVFIDEIESARFFERISQILGGFWILPAFAGWLILNSAFLWMGILVYILTLSSCGRTFHGKNIRQAFLLAPLVFAPVFGAWFAVCMLDWTFPFANETLATTPWGQVADFRMLADVMRFPYFIALLCVLWNAIPESKHTSRLLPVDSLSIESSTQSTALKLESTLDSYTVKRFLGFMACAGLINAMLAGMLLCRLPEIHAPTLSALFVRSVFQIVLGAIAGVGGSWLYWKNPSSPLPENSPVPFPLFALVCAAGWIWMPSMMLLSDQFSPFTAAVAMIAAFALASGLRSVTYCVFAPALSSADFSSYDNDLFAESLYRAPVEPHGYIIAIGLFAAGAALLTRSNWTAAAFLATSAAVFAWKRTAPRSQPSANRETYRRAALRLALVAIPAMLVTMWALLDGIAHRNLIAQAALNAAEKGATGKDADANKKKNSASGLSGYESLILWPFPEKKDIVPPVKSFDPFLAPGTSKPLVIRFDGVYRYVQPPDETPGPNAHKAHGTPLALNIEVTNSFPLLMDAHQELPRAIPLDRCREIDVEVENRDNHAGLIALGVLLGDEASRKKPTLYLGSKPLESTQPGHFSYKSMPVSETLRFAVPLDSKVRRFNEITVLVLPDIEHRFLAPKIAIQQFQILPR